MNFYLLCPRGFFMAAIGCLAVAACGGRPDGGGESPPLNSVSTTSGSMMAAEISDSQSAERSAVRARRVAVLAAAASAQNAMPIEEQMAQFRRELAELRGIVARLPSGANGLAVDSPNPRTDPVGREEQERATQQRLANAEAAFRQQGNDPAISQAAADNMRTAFREASAGVEGLGGALGHVDCRNQGCRVELLVEPGSSAMQALPTVLAHLGPSFSSMTAGQFDRGDGRTAMLMYFNR